MQAVMNVRYMDDTLVAFENKTDATKFLRYLNSLHNNLEFTMEQENNDIIPFLDLLIIRDRRTDVIETAVYRKPTHSGVFTNYTSFMPHYFNDNSTAKSCIHT